MVIPLTEFEAGLKAKAASVYNDHVTDGQKSAVYDGGGAGTFIHGCFAENMKYAAKIVNQTADCGIVGLGAYSWSPEFDPKHGTGVEIDVGDHDVFMRSIMVDLGVPARIGYRENIDGLTINSCRTLYLYDGVIDNVGDGGVDLKAPAFIERVRFGGGYRLARIRNRVVFRNCQFYIPSTGQHFLEMWGDECEVWFDGACEFYDEDGNKLAGIPTDRIQHDNTNYSLTQIRARIHPTENLPAGANHEFFVQARAMGGEPPIPQPEPDPTPVPNDPRVDDLIRNVADLRASHDTVVTRLNQVVNGLRSIGST